MRILTVGDGDLTLSLALARCYGSQIKLTATTLCSSYQELCDTYSNSADVIQELTRQRQATVLYGVDATKLSQNPELVAASVFDLIVFHHPHLGLMTSNDSASDEQFQAQRHFVLLAHYLASAKALLLLQCREHVPATTVNHDNHYNPMIHLCITHHQAQTWEMKRAAQRNGLRLVQTAKTNAPFHAIINPLFYTTTTKLTNLPKEPGFAAPRRYRNGKLGSHHYLAGYGYMHRRTHGEKHAGKADMNVEGSKHYFFVANDDDNQPQNDTGKGESFGSIFACHICGLSCESKDALNNHLEAPALPDPPAMDINEKKRPPPTTEHGSNNNFGARDTTATASNNKDPIAADNNNNNNNSWNVTKEHSGKRLRRFLQHVAFPKRARKKCDKLVTEGQILVNGSVAKDTSRILTSGDIVSTNEKDVTVKLQAIHASLQPDLPILAAWDGPKHAPGSNSDGRSGRNNNALVVVVNKPVGMRTKGIYESARTIEQIVSDQLEARYHSLSSVDTGIGGLCVLQRQPVGGTCKKKIDNQDFVELDNIRLDSEFTALVHGHVPSGWDDPGIQVAVPIRSIRKWGQQREELQNESDPANAMIDEDNHDDEDQGVDDDTDWTMKIVCTERTLTRGRSQDDEPAPALCTLQISTTCQASGLCRAIILYLRKQRYPVVGDRLCQRELGQLPRSMRNRIKKKLLMGCFGVQLSATVRSSSIDKKIGEPTSTNVSVVVEDDKTRSSVVDCQVDIPERYSANFWHSHWENATTLDPNASTS